MASWRLPAVRGAPQGMSAPHGRRLLPTDEALDIALQLLRLPTQAVQLAADGVGLLVRGSVDFALDALERAVRQPQQLEEIVRGV